MTQLDPEIESAVLAALDALLLRERGVFSRRTKPRVAVELAGAVMERSPSHDFICTALDGSMRNCEIRQDAVEALRLLSASLRDRVSVLVECEGWRRSLARNWMLHSRFRQLTGVTEIEFCPPGWSTGWDVGSGSSHLVVGASQLVPAPASTVTMYRVHGPDADRDDAGARLMTWEEIVVAVLEAEELSVAADQEIDREIARLETLIGGKRLAELRKQQMDDVMAKAAEEGFYVVESDLNRLMKGDEPFHFDMGDPPADE